MIGINPSLNWENESHLKKSLSSGGEVEFVGGRGKSVDGWLHPRWQRLFLKMLGLNLSVLGLSPLVTAVDM